MTQDLNLLAELCALPGLSGFEQAVTARLAAELQAAGFETRLDGLGSLIAHRTGPGPRVLLFAHADEVGLIVRKLHSGGFLAFERVGGTSPHVLPGKKVRVWTENGPLPGVVGAMPMHLVNEHPQPDLPGMYIDLGVGNRAEAEALGVQVGLPVTYAPDFETIGGCVASKSLDDRAGCWLLVELARRVAQQPPACDLTLAFLVQEENMLQAGLPVLASVHPDYAVGVDATLAFDTPDLADGQSELCLGGGPAFKVMDRIRGAGLGFIAHPGLRRHLESLASAAGIPFQREVVMGLSTNATPLPFAGEGLPVAAVSFPLRYSHSSLEVANLKDLQLTLDLLEQAVRSPWPGA